MSDKLTLEEKTRAGKAWKQYIKEKSPDGTVRVMITSKDPEKSEKKDSPFPKKSDKKDDDKGEKKENPFGKKSDKKDDKGSEKKDNPFTKKSDKKDDGDSGEKKEESPFGKKSEKKDDKGEKKENPFAKKEWVFMFPTWQEWVEAKEQ